MPRNTYLVQRRRSDGTWPTVGNTHQSIVYGYRYADRRNALRYGILPYLEGRDGRVEVYSPHGTIQGEPLEVFYVAGGVIVTAEPPWEDVYEAHCDHCGKDTPHVVAGECGERDSSGETFTCTVCQWYSVGMSGQQHPPDRTVTA